MIAASDKLTVEWLSINDVVFGDAQSCSVGTALTYTNLMAEDGDEGHLAPPIVSPDPDVAGRYRIRDGKHRYLAHLALGRSRVRCLVVTPAGKPAT